MSNLGSDVADNCSAPRDESSSEVRPADRPFLSVVIPVYQAERILPALCSRLDAALSSLCDHFEVIMVEDRSRDNSWEVLERLASEYSWMVAVRLSRNFGQAYGDHGRTRHGTRDVDRCHGLRPARISRKKSEPCSPRHRKGTTSSWPGAMNERTRRPRNSGHGCFGEFSRCCQDTRLTTRLAPSESCTSGSLNPTATCASRPAFSVG